jgi:hypothetical protein
MFSAMHNSLVTSFLICKLRRRRRRRRRMRRRRRNNKTFF